MNYPPAEGRSRDDTSAVAPLLKALRQHPLVVLLTVVSALAAAIAFLTFRDSEYEATATVLVNPLPQDDQTFLGLQLLRSTGDAVGTVQTAAALLESQAAAEATAEALGADWTAKKVLNSVDVAPQGESNVLDVNALANDPELAAELADEFVDATLTVREDALTQQVNAEIRRAEAELAPLDANDPAAADLSATLSQLRSIRASGDPTIVADQPATIPTDPIGPGPLVVVALALLGGLALGAGGALLWELLDRRIRDARDALSVVPAPILARLPQLARARSPRGARWYIPPEMIEPYRSLAAQLEQQEKSPRVILLTSATRGDGKTTSAVDLAVTLASAGKNVILLDFDLRDPRVALALTGASSALPANLLDPQLSLEPLLIRPSPDLPLRALVVGINEDEPDPDELVIRQLPRLIEQARAQADFVIVDTPPLGQVSDALWLLPDADAILLVVRVGNTSRSHLERAQQLLDRGGHATEGLIMIDPTERPGAGYYGRGAASRTGLIVGGNGELAPAQSTPETGADRRAVNEASAHGAAQSPRARGASSAPEADE